MSRRPTAIQRFSQESIMSRNNSRVFRKIGLALLIATAGRAQAQCGPQTLYGPDRAAGDYEGDNCAVRGAFALISAPTKDNGAYESGKAYCFQNSNGNWTSLGTLSPNDPQALGLFGWGAAITDPYAVVGAMQA